jgi:hypothetical protein
MRAPCKSIQKLARLIPTIDGVAPRSEAKSGCAGESIMTQSIHDRVAELHNLAAHAHAAAAVAHRKADLLAAHELSKQAHELSMSAHRFAEECFTASNDFKRGQPRNPAPAL